MRAIVAATTSPRLCGGMLVAMPTAMPVAPLISSSWRRRDGNNRFYAEESVGCSSWKALRREDGHACPSARRQYPALRTNQQRQHQSKATTTTTTIHDSMPDPSGRCSRGHERVCLILGCFLVFSFGDAIGQRQQSQKRTRRRESDEIAHHRVVPVSGMAARPARSRCRRSWSSCPPCRG